MIRSLVLGLSLAVTFAMILAADSNTGSVLSKMLTNSNHSATAETSQEPELAEGETGELYQLEKWRRRRRGKLLKNILIAKIPHPHVGTVLPKAFLTAGLAIRNSGGGWGGGGGGGGGWGGGGWGGGRGWGGGGPGWGGGGGGGGGWGPPQGWGWGGGGWGGWGGGGGGGGWCESKKVRKAKAKAKKKIAKAKAKQQKKAAKAGVGQGWGPPQGWGWGGQGGGQGSGGGGGWGGWGGWGKTGGGGGGQHGGGGGGQQHGGGGGGWRSLDENDDGPPPGMKESQGNSLDLDSEFKDDEIWPNSPPRTGRIGLQMDEANVAADNSRLADNGFQPIHGNQYNPPFSLSNAGDPTVPGYRVLTDDTLPILLMNGMSASNGPLDSRLDTNGDGRIQANLADAMAAASTQSNSAGADSTVTMSQSMFLKLICPSFPSMCMYMRS